MAPIENRTGETANYCIFGIVLADSAVPMDNLTRVLLVLHFLGLAMGLSTSFGNIVIAGLINKAAPAERPVLVRFPPAMSRVGSIGLTLLWLTGLGMILTKWGGFGNVVNMPWTFHAKLTLVAILTGVIGYLHAIQPRIESGDAAAFARAQAFGKVAFALAVAVVVLAVISFD
jgi:hypothetical protein